MNILEPFSNRPVLVFWETTRACALSCIHCRASAITQSLPGELSTEEASSMIHNVASFGRPYPTIIFTGGDPLQRKDLFELMGEASRLGIGFAVSPAVTDLLSLETLEKIKQVGASSISVSLDGASKITHDAIRRKDGTFESTIDAIRNAVKLGLNIQVNTAIMRTNLEELPDIFHLIKTLGVRTWELFFLIKVGRGNALEDLSPYECESACNFLYDTSCYGITVRTVEAPFIRRIASMRADLGEYWKEQDYAKLRARLFELEGKSNRNPSTLRPRGTLDGDGIVFVAYDGAIYPGGLLPVPLGNVKEDDLVRVYRGSDLLGKIRQRKMSGHCGVCAFKEVCGGSRARAFSRDSDPLSSDLACVYAYAMN